MQAPRLPRDVDNCADSLRLYRTSFPVAFPFSRIDARKIGDVEQ
jgi:hypothetical protein